MNEDQKKTAVPRLFELPIKKIPTRFLRMLAYIVKRPLESLIGFRRMNEIYANVYRMPETIPFCDRSLLGIGVKVSYNEEELLARIPKEGPVVVVANHPFGGLEGIILLALVKRVRPDVKAMANYLLGTIPEMRELFIFVDPFGSKNATRVNMRPIKEAISWLKDNHLLIVFPAGEVSSFRRKGMRICDPAWSATIAAFVRKSNATVVPMYFPGRNSLFFCFIGLIHPILRTIMLPRQLVNKKGRTLAVRIGLPIPPKQWEPFSTDDVHLITYLRFRTYLQAERETHRTRRFISFHPPMMPPDPIIAPIAPDQMAKEIAALPEENILVRAGDFIVFIATPEQIPGCLKEIGRLREITFRAVGEGTGNEIDLDSFDNYYLHLVMWNTERQEIAGSYRLGLTDQIIEAHGVKGLYTRTLFKFNNKLIEKLPPMIEMGRSFIRIEYQKAYTSLFLLWRGIAMFIVRNPRYRVLFGPVSITNEYREASRCMILASMRQTCMDAELAPLVKPKFPPHPPRRAEWCQKEYRDLLNDIENVADYVAEIEPDGKDIPVLLRQYLKLGGRLLSFNVDPDFSSVVDGLIVVDLARTPLKTLRRYMGNDADTYLKSHGITEDAENKTES